MLLCIHPGTNEHRGRYSQWNLEVAFGSGGGLELPQVLVVFLENPGAHSFRLKMSGMEIGNCPVKDLASFFPYMWA